MSVTTRYSNRMTKPDKLYRRVCDAVMQRLNDGEFAVGARLPTERELAETYKVSRPTVREAMVALEMLGIVDMRKGSGIYVVGHEPNENVAAHLDVGAFELMEARRVYEVETAGLAATRIDKADLGELEALIVLMEQEDELSGELADRNFHLVIARATGNSAMVAVTTELWELRARCDLARTIMERARGTGLAPRIAEHRVILEALKAGSAQGARQAMQAHLDAVIEHLLDRTENDVIEAARSRTAGLRKRMFGGAR
jgi:DNA-binding FadR family transcriptional regulator